MEEADTDRVPEIDEVFASGGGCGQLMAAVDWEQHSLGPPEAWPESLRTAVGISLASPFPMLVFWGPQLILLYNDGFREILVEKHPAAMAAPTEQVFPELAAVAGEARTPEAACVRAAEALAAVPDDVPFAVVYLERMDGSLELEAAGRVAGEPQVTDPARWGLDDVGAGEQRVVDLGEPLILGDKEIRQAVVLPLVGGGDERPFGYLVAGTSPHRALDDDYRGFLRVAAGHLSSAIVEARAYEAERSRAEALAKLDRAKSEFLRSSRRGLDRRTSSCRT